MDSQRFWDEEIRGFPVCGRGAAFWVIRQEGTELTAPVRQIFGWAVGEGKKKGMATRPPLGIFLQVLSTNTEVFQQRQKEGAAIWVEPLACQDGVRGCLGIWFDAQKPFQESVFLWGQRLAAHLGPVLKQLTPIHLENNANLIELPPTLFPLPPTEVASSVVTSRLPPTKLATCGTWLSLPYPVEIPGIPGCVGISKEMRQLGEKLGDIAHSDVNVLINGESGTGKEIVAQAIHLCSDRYQESFIGQNCAALPESLFESELFGHRAGSFTGAAGDKPGLLASTNGGTFFLDEIGDMPLALQIKLLRVMQERKIRRIGDLVAKDVNIRFVAATHKNLENEIKKGRFRLDLFYRLKVVNLVIPPLKHRPEDVLPLMALFLKKAGADPNTMKISEDAVSALQAWRWPGNVRELENEVHRLVALNPDQKRISLTMLSPEIQGSRGKQIIDADLGTLRELGQATEILEQYLIRKAIAATEGKKAAAARKLGLSRQGLYKKMQRYGMSDLVSVTVSPQAWGT